MEVEHRASTRRPISQRIMLNRQHDQAKLAEVRNLSIEGAFVHMNPIDFTPQTSVDMVIALRAGASDEMHRVPAQVVRVTRDGVALRFLQYSDRTYTALVNLLCLIPQPNLYSS